MYLPTDYYLRPNSGFALILYYCLQEKNGLIFPKVQYYMRGHIYFLGEGTGKINVLVRRGGLYLFWIIVLCQFKKFEVFLDPTPPWIRTCIKRLDTNTCKHTKYSKFNYLKRPKIIF